MGFLSDLLGCPLGFNLRNAAGNDWNHCRNVANAHMNQGELHDAQRIHDRQQPDDFIGLWQAMSNQNCDKDECSETVFRHPSQDGICVVLPNGQSVFVPSRCLPIMTRGKVIVKTIRRASLWRCLCVVGLHWVKWSLPSIDGVQRGCCVRCRQWQVR